MPDVYSRAGNAADPPSLSPGLQSHGAALADAGR